MSIVWSFHLSTAWWILENLWVDNKEEVIILHWVHVEQNLSSLLFSFGYCARTRKVNPHLRHPEDSDYQIFDSRLLQQSRSLSSTPPSPSLLSLCFTFAMDSANTEWCCKKPKSLWQNIASNNTPVHLLFASWGKNHKLDEYTNNSGNKTIVELDLLH